MAGKGSNPRPFSVTLEEFGNNHERIYGKKPPRPQYVPPPLPPELLKEIEEKNAKTK
jgi:hypothetical protein